MNAERVRILSEYRQATEQLLASVSGIEALVDEKAMQECLQRRDDLIAQWNALGDAGSLQGAEREQANRIQQLDAETKAAMQRKMQDMQRQMVQMRTHQRGLDNYRDNYSVDAYFIDHKK